MIKIDVMNFIINFTNAKKVCKSLCVYLYVYISMCKSLCVYISTFHFFTVKSWIPDIQF